MVKTIYTNLSEVFDPETGEGCGGGCGDPSTMTIYIDERLSPEMKYATIIHETVELFCKGRIRHTKINDLTKALIQVINDYKTLQCDSSPSE